MTACSTVGILYPGELGAALGALLVRRGVRVVTTLQGRSDRSGQTCRVAELIPLPSPIDVVRESNILFSVIPPAAAQTLAEQYAAWTDLSPPNAIYVDVNSIGPELAASLAGKITSRGRTFVDAAIHGQARNLAAGATLYLSGKRADEVATLFDDAMRCRILGEHPGQASALKMILAGMSKGICSLFLEVAILARRQGMLDDMNAEIAQFYPGILEAVQRMLPTYPQHSARRVVEMRELEETCHSVGQQPAIFTAVRQLLEEFTALPFDVQTDTRWTVGAIVEHLLKNQFLAQDRPLRPQGDFYRKENEHGQQTSIR